MIQFDNDYTTGAHEAILNRLVETNNVQMSGYGTDPHSKNARNAIKKACGSEDIDVYFVTGGTQANIISINASLRPYQGVITADTGHINVLEAGAIEAIGHKLLEMPSEDGKIYAADVRELCEEYEASNSQMHVVQPGMIYLSNPTENGTLYTKQELEELRSVSDDHNLILFMDGARLGYSLVAEENDITLAEITALFDIFYIGGTKIGALFGEAIVIRNEEIQAYFQTVIKQKGGLLAKGRTLGIQFEVLFEDKLYFELSKNAVTKAMQIKEALLDQGIQLKYEASTNQLFPIMPNAWLEILEEKYKFNFWHKENETETVVRICTSWDTTSENVEALIEGIKKL